MYKIDFDKFDKMLLQFMGCVLAIQDNDHYHHSTKISFDSGFLAEAEGYKYSIWQKAQSILECATWTKDNLRKYHIAQRMLSCINMSPASGEKQNLLNWHDVEYFKDVIADHPQQIEDVLYQIYCTNDDEKSFNSAIRLLGNRYPLISFLFFLKEKTDFTARGPYYLPVRPQTINRQFQKLGIQTDCLTDGCTWHNYQEYLQILSDVQKRLRTQLDAAATMLDTHSFVWSMWLLDKQDSSSLSQLPSEFKQIDHDITHPGIQGTTRDAMIKVRVNQSVFRECLLNRYHKCCLCGVSNPNLLIASHIKPWADSTSIERLDTDNGFLFCPNHDRLFDQGWISFEDTGSILISKELAPYDRVFTNVHDGMKLHLTVGNKVYLNYHRQHIFKE